MDYPGFNPFHVGRLCRHRFHRFPLGILYLLWPAGSHRIRWGFHPPRCRIDDQLVRKTAGPGHQSGNFGKLHRTIFAGTGIYRHRFEPRLENFLCPHWIHHAGGEYLAVFDRDPGQSLQILVSNHMAVKEQDLPPDRVPTKNSPGTMPQDLGLRMALGTYSFWLFLVIMFVCGSGDFLVAVHLVAFLTDFGITFKTAGNILALFGLLSLGGYFDSRPRIGSVWKSMADRIDVCAAVYGLHTDIEIPE